MRWFVFVFFVTLGHHTSFNERYLIQRMALYMCALTLVCGRCMTQIECFSRIPTFVSRLCSCVGAMCFSHVSVLSLVRFTQVDIAAVSAMETVLDRWMRVTG